MVGTAESKHVLTTLEDIMDLKPDPTQIEIVSAFNALSAIPRDTITKEQRNEKKQLSAEMNRIAQPIIVFPDPNLITLHMQLSTGKKRSKVHDAPKSVEGFVAERAGGLNSKKITLANVIPLNPNDDGETEFHITSTAYMIVGNPVENNMASIIATLSTETILKILENRFYDASSYGDGAMPDLLNSAQRFSYGVLDVSRMATISPVREDFLNWYRDNKIRLDLPKIEDDDGNVIYGHEDLPGLVTCHILNVTGPDVDPALKRTATNLHLESCGAFLLDVCERANTPESKDGVDAGGVMPSYGYPQNAEAMQENRERIAKKEVVVEDRLLEQFQQSKCGKKIPENITPIPLSETNNIFTLEAV